MIAFAHPEELHSRKKMGWRCASGFVPLVQPRLSLQEGENRQMRLPYASGKQWHFSVLQAGKTSNFSNPYKIMSNFLDFDCQIVLCFTLFNLGLAARWGRSP
jgi:hypothetical protein